MICAKNGWKMRRPFSPPCLLPNEMVDVTSWLVMSRSFFQYIMTSHVDSVERLCGHKADTCFSKQKFMFRIIWNPSGFSIADRIPNDAKINSDYFVINILSLLDQAIFPRESDPHQKRLAAHLDNCWLQNSQVSTDWIEDYGIHRMPYPPIILTWFDSQWFLIVSDDKNSNELKWLTKTSFLSPCKRY
jgi:hypothetical protein